jgi:hypothetical protein
MVTTSCKYGWSHNIKESSTSNELLSVYVICTQHLQTRDCASQLSFLYDRPSILSPPSMSFGTTRFVSGFPFYGHCLSHGILDTCISVLSHFPDSFFFPLALFPSSILGDRFRGEDLIPSLLREALRGEMRFPLRSNFPALTATPLCDIANYKLKPRAVEVNVTQRRNSV